MNLREQLTRDEGVVLHSYRDSVGLWTIGVGHLLSPQAPIPDITMQHAMDLLDSDIASHQRLLAQALPWVALLDPVRKGAMDNMYFNLGNRLLGFRKFLAYMERHDFQKAAAEMLDSTWARQVGARSTRLSKQILTGEWQ